MLYLAKAQVQKGSSVITIKPAVLEELAKLRANPALMRLQTSLLCYRQLLNIVKD
jgi:hypothetical protein